MDKVLRFAVLAPHRDAVKPLRAYSRALFAAGCSGAFSFPAAVPLAQVHRPLRAAELRALAHALREASLCSGGKWYAAPVVTLAFPAFADRPLALFGPALSLGQEGWGVDEARALPRLLNGLSPDAVEYLFPQLVLPAALLSAGEPAPDLAGPAALPETGPAAQPLSFRAAAVANLSFQALGSGDAAYSYRWKIGPLVWLPSEKTRPAIPREGHDG
jgi:hypothetical protein